jgi:hypothetical protein
VRFVCRFLAEPCRRDIWRRALGHADRVLDQVGCWAWCPLVGPSNRFRGMAQQLGWGRSDSDNVRYLGKFGVHLLAQSFTVPDP